MRRRFRGWCWLKAEGKERWGRFRPRVLTEELSMYITPDPNAKFAPSRLWRRIAVCAATLAILSGLSIRANAIRGALQRPYATFPGAGSEWIKWTDQERQLFVAGYVAGYAGGALDDCKTFDIKFAGENKWRGPDDNPLAN